MPIKPENKARYPKDWKDVRHRILQRANWPRWRQSGWPTFTPARTQMALAT